MLAKHQYNINAIYAEYRKNLKPLIAEIESIRQKFPTGILNEIRSCFDHISRCYLSDDDKKIQINVDRAMGHIRRAQLDCYKTLIVFFCDETSVFREQNKNKDWSTVDGGRFNSKFLNYKARPVNHFYPQNASPTVLWIGRQHVSHTGSFLVLSTNQKMSGMLMKEKH